MPDVHLMKKIGFLTNILLVTLVSCSGDIHKPEVKVKNIILMIGDGMGVAQVYAAYTANKGKLNLEKARFIGFSKTSSADNYITDSGAGATAIATGQKTNNESIGIDAQGRARKTILESAEESGLATGLLVTCPITHATPAAFYAHQFDRIQNENIAKDLLHSGTDIFIGGGKVYFEKRTDSINYSDSLANEGYSIVYTLDSINREDSSKVGCFTADEDMPPIFEGRGDYLPKATHIALEKLGKNKKGFFIMIEGSQIDWGGHSNDVSFVTSEVIDFDRAVGIAFTFADQNPGTLVIVTADHETGGMAITGGDIKTGTVEASFSTIEHTATMVPVYTYGTDAEEFAGIYENTEIFYKMMRLLGLDE
jgi:alkaline phosphatase